jgi:hypothetical protein
LARHGVFGRWGHAVLVGGLALLAAALLCGGAQVTPASADACANEVRRAEQGAIALALPDCRAYELVSLDSLLGQDQEPARASLTGDAITYYSTFPAEDAETSSYYQLATRGADGWSSRGIGPQAAPAVFFEEECEQNIYFSADLTKNIDEEGWFEGDDIGRCKRVQDAVVPGEPHPYRNVFLHDVAADSYQLVNVTPAEVEPANAKFQDASDDFSRILFSEEAELTPEAVPGHNLYLWEGGVVRLVTFLPDGTPATGELVDAAGYRRKSGTTIVGSGFAPMTGAVSVDGRRAFFYSGAGLYVRLNADQPQSAVSGGECTEPLLACTVQVDLSRGPGTSGGGVFWRASPDGSKVFFTAVSKLTTDSTAASNSPDLYEYDLASGALSDLTVNAAEPANVRGVAGASEDTSRIYFVANAALAPGASLGQCTGTTATAIQNCNLYAFHDGSISFIAALSRTDRNVWQEGTAVATPARARRDEIWANTSANGRFFAFTSIRSLTGYDNRDIDDDKPTRQIYLYDAEGNGGAGQLSCVSCIPGGARPDDNSVDIFLGGHYGPDYPGSDASWKTNAVLDDGRVYFDTEDPLLPEDTNGRRDVYEYHDGQLHLISAGTYAGSARFLDASPTGSDVFFRTPQSLVGHDDDRDNVSLYDARVGGGFPEPEPIDLPCEGESCREGVPAAPAGSLAGSSTLQVSGNPARQGGRKPKRCKRGKARRKQRRCNRSSRRNKRSATYRNRPRRVGK